MLFEKRWPAVASLSLTADGTTSGVLTVADTRQLHVKQKINLKSNTQTSQVLQVNRVLSLTQFAVGKVDDSITNRADVSAFRVVDSANVSANEQTRPNIGWEDYWRAVFAEEPAVALRTLSVDELGNPWNASNPLPVAFDGTVNIGQVRITACDNDPMAGDVHSAIRIAGVNCDQEMVVNPDGSINVNLVAEPAGTGLTVTYNEVTSVASGVETDVVTLTAGISGAHVMKIDASGENVALYRVKVNGTTIDTKRTYWGGGFNVEFAFEPFQNGLKLNSGDVLTVTVLHNRPDLANFEGTVMSL